MDIYSFLIRAIALICMWSVVAHLEKGLGWALFVTILLVCSSISIGGK